MSSCHTFRPVPGHCGPNRRGPVPAPPFNPQDYWATKRFVSSLFGSLDTTKLDKADVVDPSTATEIGKAADAKKTQEELNRILGVASDAQALAESKADKATTLSGYGITDAATKAELAAKADLVGGKVPAAQLPSFVDDVLEYDTVSAFPVAGADGKIYVAKDTNLTYRWSGTKYVEISPSVALGETASTAYPGDKGKAAAETASSAYSIANNLASALDDKRDKGDRAVYEVVRTENTDWTWTSAESEELAETLNANGVKPVYASELSAWAYTGLLPDEWVFMEGDNSSPQSSTRVNLRFSNPGQGVSSALATATRPRYMDETLGPAKANVQLAAVAAGDEQTPANGDLVKYDAADNRFVKAIAGTDYIPLVKDSAGNKTAVTIGNRIGTVGPFSIANGYDVTASEYYSHAEGSETVASGATSHAEGLLTIANGQSSHAEGRSTAAYGSYSHTEGCYSKTRTDDDYAFAWNGDDTKTEESPYISNGPGTFNINPAGGLYGFFIGKQTLPQVINSVIAERLSAIDPDNASVYDLIKALKGE